MQKFKPVSELDASLARSKKKLETEEDMEVVRQYLSSLQRKGGPYEHNLAYLMRQMQIELEKQQ